MEYLETFNKTPRIEWNKSKYPAASEECVDFLNRALQFNPYFRMGVDEALNHPLFSNIRDAEKENRVASQITLDFEKVGDGLDREVLRQFILQECTYSK